MFKSARTKLFLVALAMTCYMLLAGKKESVDWFWSNPNLPMIISPFAGTTLLYLINLFITKLFFKIAWTIQRWVKK